MRFYILDDDINTVQMLSNLIEDLDLGKVVRTATDPQEAIHEIETLGIDICLLDYLMPKLDGSTLIKKVKEKKQISGFYHDFTGERSGNGVGFLFKRG